MTSAQWKSETLVDRLSWRVHQRLGGDSRIWILLRRRVGILGFGGIVSVLVGVTGFAAYTNVSQKGWNADAAAWAQAAGTVIAIVGAAWLARSESRRARRRMREQREEAAWGVRFVLVQAQFDSQIVAAELTKADKPLDEFDIRSWRQRAANAALALQTMLTRTDHIHPAVILTTCNAKILVDQLSSDLERLDKLVMRDQRPDDQVVTDIVYAHINLNALLEQFDGRMRGVRKTLDRGDDLLPLAAWPEWDPYLKPQEDQGK
jgi:hypothetical protein